MKLIAIHFYKRKVIDVETGQSFLLCSAIDLSKIDPFSKGII